MYAKISLLFLTLTFNNILTSRTTLKTVAIGDMVAFFQSSKKIVIFYEKGYVYSISCDTWTTNYCGTVSTDSKCFWNSADGDVCPDNYYCDDNLICSNNIADQITQSIEGDGKVAGTCEANEIWNLDFDTTTEILRADLSSTIDTSGIERVVYCENDEYLIWTYQNTYKYDWSDHSITHIGDSPDNTKLKYENVNKYKHTKCQTKPVNTTYFDVAIVLKTDQNKIQFWNTDSFAYNAGLEYTSSNGNINGVVSSRETDYRFWWIENTVLKEMTNNVSTTLQTFSEQAALIEFRRSDNNNNHLRVFTETNYKNYKRAIASIDKDYQFDITDMINFTFDPSFVIIHNTDRRLIIHVNDRMVVYIIDTITTNTIRRLARRRLFGYQPHFYGHQAHLENTFWVSTRHGLSIISSYSLEVLKIYYAEWDWTDYRNFNYVQMTGLKMSLTTFADPYYSMLDCQGCMRISSWDDSTSNPLLVVSESILQNNVVKNKIEQYNFGTSTWNVIEEDASRHYWDATYTESKYDIVWLSNTDEDLEFVSTTQTSTITYCNNVGGFITQASWDWTTNGILRSVSYFSISTQGYIIQTDINRLIVRKYDKTDQSATLSQYCTLDITAHPLTVVTQFYADVNIIMGFNRISLFFVRFDSVNFTLSDPNFKITQPFNSWTTTLFTNHLLAFAENKIYSIDLVNLAERGTLTDKYLDTIGYCKLQDSTEILYCGIGEKQFTQYDLSAVNVPLDSTDLKSDGNCPNNCDSCKFTTNVCNTCNGSSFIYQTQCYPKNCYASNEFFNNDSFNTNCVSSCPDSISSFVSCICTDATNKYLDPATLTCSSSCNRSNNKYNAVVSDQGSICGNIFII